MRHRALSSAGWALLVTATALTAPAAAKDVRVKPVTDAPLTPEQSAALERALNFDAVAATASAPARSFGTPRLKHPKTLHVSRSENADGSSTVTVAKPLSNDARVGADVKLAGEPATTYEPNKPLPGTANEKSSGAAFASLGVTHFATLDARVDPDSKQGQLGATVEHSVPLGGDMSVTLHGHYAVSDTLPETASTQRAAATAPVLSDDQAVKLNIASTGTTLSAGVSGTSTNPATHNTLSAEQKVYGPLHVTTAITDPGEPTSNKSVTAGFNLTW